MIREPRGTARRAEHKRPAGQAQPTGADSTQGAHHSLTCPAPEPPPSLGAQGAGLAGRGEPLSSGCRRQTTWRSCPRSREPGERPRRVSLRKRPRAARQRRVEVPWGRGAQPPAPVGLPTEKAWTGRQGRRRSAQTLLGTAPGKRKGLHPTHTPKRSVWFQRQDCACHCQPCEEVWKDERSKASSY